MKHDPSQWLQADVKDVEPAARQFLETYAGIPPEEVVPHVLAIRDKAFGLYPWPCIGQIRFLRFHVAMHASYHKVLERLSKPGSMFLDLGCCFGTDIRKLFIDGVKPSQLVGMDLVPEFNNMGYELFRDSEKLAYEFHALDIMDDSTNWKPLEDRFDVLQLASFLHIWDWAGQVKAASRVVSFTKPGAFLIGGGLGSGVGGEFPNLEGTGTNFRQSQETIQKFWREVGERTNTKWDVSSTFKSVDASRENMHQDWAEPTMGFLEWEVTRTL